MNHGKYILLLELIEGLQSCKHREEFDDLMDQLTTLIPFHDFGLMRIAASSGKHVWRYEIVQWFSKSHGWKEFYEENKQFEHDPGLRYFVDNMERRFSNIHQWSDVRQKYLRHDPKHTKAFLDASKRYRMNQHGFNWFHKYHPMFYFLISLSGEFQQSLEELSFIMKLLAPAIRSACERIPIGITEKLTDREIELHQTFQTCLRSRELSRIFGVSVSTIEKYKAIIMGKVGTSRYKLTPVTED